MQYRVDLISDPGSQRILGVGDHNMFHLHVKHCNVLVALVFTSGNIFECLIMFYDNWQ